MAAGVTPGRRMLTRRNDVLARLALLVCCALPACAGRPGSDTTLSSCYSGADAPSTAVLYASDHGFFGRNGLQVTMVFANGGAASVATLLSGQTPICQMSGANVVAAAQAGEDVVIVAGIVNSTPFTLMTAPSITRPEQLVGRTLASPAAGGSYELALRLYLSSLGVPFDQVKYTPLGSQLAVVAAMQAGEVAGALEVPPDTQELRARGFVDMPFGPNAPRAFQHIALVTTRRYVEAHRSVVLAYVRAVGEAIAAMKQDEAGAIRTIAKYRRLDPVAQKDALAAAYRDVVLARFESVPTPSLEGMSYIISQLPPAPGARTITAADVVDPSIVAELQQAGAFGRPQP